MTTEYRIECRYAGGYEGKWQQTWDIGTNGRPGTYRGDEGKAKALEMLAVYRDQAKHTLWEYRIVSREVTEWTEVDLTADTTT